MRKSDRVAMCIALAVYNFADVPGLGYLAVTHAANWIVAL